MDIGEQSKPKERGIRVESRDAEGCEVVSSPRFVHWTQALLATFRAGLASVLYVPFDGSSCAQLNGHGQHTGLVKLTAPK